MTRRTKIVATIGPASEDPAVSARLSAAGVDVVRLNLCHGVPDDHRRVMEAVRAAADRSGRAVGVLADLPGPKIRSGPFPEHGVDLVPGATIALVAGDGPSSQGVITVDYPDVVAEIEPGNRIAIGDGGISLRARSVADGRIDAVIESGGRAQGRPGVHVVGERMRLSAPTPHDLELAETFAAAGVDFLALSFVRRASDIQELRQVVGDRAEIVAKIETSSALNDLEAIIRTADGIMVARGDLGIDCPIENVPHLQKDILRRCVEVGRPVITATQMLESMTEAPVPTRAEVSDVANAVFDGTDAVMLSGETAIGRDPVGVVRTMARIAERAESESSYRRWAERLGRRQQVRADDDPVDRITAAITHAAWQAALDVSAPVILCCTRSGRTARSMARYRPAARLVGVSPNARTVNRLTLSWGVQPIQVGEHSSSDDMVWFAVESALQQGLVANGDVVVVLAGSPDRHGGAATDVLRLVRVHALG